MNGREAWVFFEGLLESAARFIEREMKVKPALVIHFGSSASPPLKYSSDIDLLFVFRELPSGRSERFALVEDFEAFLEEPLRRLAEAGYRYELSPLVRPVESLGRLSPIYLDLPIRSKTLFDPDGLGVALFARVKAFMERNGTRREVVNGLPVWVYRPDLRNGERFIDDF